MIDKRDVQAFFDRLAPDWDAGMVRNEAVIARILDNAGVCEGCTVLDVIAAMIEPTNKRRKRAFGPMRLAGMTRNTVINSDLIADRSKSERDSAAAMRGSSRKAVCVRAVEITSPRALSAMPMMVFAALAGMPKAAVSSAAIMPRRSKNSPSPVVSKRRSSPRFRRSGSSRLTT